MSRSSNEPAAPNATNFLNNFKYEVASELGMNNYQTVDKGQLSSRENGYVGGYMVKKMIQYAEQNMPTSGNSMTMGMNK
ncbi:MAG: alpha/beta-type small acid-soluble spore protein [Peptococcaceae bacterium]|nr:alpha/beta-type small acid-soluble spore protein [Peptococcaceae bacterium]